VRIEADERLRPKPPGRVDRVDLTGDIQSPDLREGPREARIVFYEGLIEVEDVPLTAPLPTSPGLPCEPERAIPEPADHDWSEIRVRLRCRRALTKFRIASSKALFLDSPSLSAVASNSRSSSASTIGPMRWPCVRSRGLPRDLRGIGCSPPGYYPARHISDIRNSVQPLICLADSRFHNLGRVRAQSTAIGSVRSTSFRAAITTSYRCSMSCADLLWNARSLSLILGRCPLRC
jgi:hypothetical protein